MTKKEEWLDYIETNLTPQFIELYPDEEFGWEDEEEWNDWYDDLEKHGLLMTPTAMKIEILYNSLDENAQKEFQIYMREWSECNFHIDHKNNYTVEAGI